MPHEVVCACHVGARRQRRVHAGTRWGDTGVVPEVSIAQGDSKVLPEASIAQGDSKALSGAHPFLIDEVKLSLDLQDSWRLVRREKGDEGVMVYGVERSPVQGPGNHTARPYIGILIQAIGEEDQRDVVAFSTNQRARVPFQVTKVFTRHDGGLGLRNAMGYEGKTEYDGHSHDLLIVHAVFRDKGIAVVMDSTTEVFPQVRAEFLRTLASLRHVEQP